MRRTLDYGTQTIEYELAFSQRKTLGVTVNPDTSVQVTAPEGSDLATIEAQLKTRRGWIVKQQQELAEFLPITPPRKYVSGETHLYLGRQYRLKVIQNAKPSVKLMRGRFMVQTPDKTDTEYIKRQLNAWYREKAHRIFDELLTRCMKRVKVIGITERPPLKIRIMEKRWGSCTASGTVQLNLKLMQVAKPLIEYVIMHELCHLVEHNHGRAYYDLLAKVIPDWHHKKKRLNLTKVA